MAVKIEFSQCSVEKHVFLLNSQTTGTHTYTFDIYSNDGVISVMTYSDSR